MENRRYDRVDVISYVRVQESNSDSTLGYVNDISIAGMRLKSLKSFSPENPCHLRISLPYGNEMIESVDIDAKVVWCNESDIEGYFDTGIQLENVKDDELSAIEKFIEYIEDSQQFFSMSQQTMSQFGNY